MTICEQYKEILSLGVSFNNLKFDNVRFTIETSKFLDKESNIINLEEFLNYKHRVIIIA